MSLMDPENYIEIMAGGNLGLLPICDHGKNVLPPRYGRLAHVPIEIRRDPFGHKSGVDEWAGRLALVIEPIMYDAAIRRIERH